MTKDQPYSELLEEWLEDLVRARDAAETDQDRIRLGDGISKAIEKLEKQKAVELRTLQEEDFVRAARDMADAFSKATFRRTQDADLAILIVQDAADDFKTRYKQLKQEKLEV